MDERSGCIPACAGETVRPFSAKRGLVVLERVVYWFFMLSFVALDVEIASRKPLFICSLGASIISDGREMGAYESEVLVKGRVRFSEIHGLRSGTLAHAPSWPQVWDQFCELIRRQHFFVAYNAAFDQSAILTMCSMHSIRPPPMTFVCARKIAAGLLKRPPRNLADAIAQLGLPFPGQPHTALADARAAASIMLASARNHDYSIVKDPCLFG